MKAQEKIDRIQNGHPARILDLFAGCGGISLGLHAAGCEIVGAVEFEARAAKSHARNFHRNLEPDIYEQHCEPKDIRVTEPEDLLKSYNLTGSAESEIDVIVGGPPCQAFARVGRVLTS